MEKTYIDYFNFYLKQCLNEIVSYFPYTKKMVLENYRALLEGNDDKNDLYVKYFMTKSNNHLLEIAKKDEQLFLNNQNLCLLEGINFHNLWQSSDSTSSNKMAVWKYLQLLVLLGRKCIPNKKEIMSMLEKVGGTIEAPDPLDNTLETKEKEEESESGGIGNLLKGLGSLTSLGKNLGGGEGGLDLGNIGESFGGIMKMAQSLTESLKDIDLSKLEEQITNTTEQTSDGNNNNNNNNNNDNQENSDNQENNEEKITEIKDNENPINNLFGSSLFGDLASEMANTFNLDEMEANGDDGTPDIGKTLGNFMKGDNPAKFMNLINKFGSKLETDMKKGKVNQNDLINQTQQMMGNLEGSGISSEQLQEQATQMFGANSPQMNRVKNSTRGLSARERLQKKYAERQKASNTK